MDIWSIWTLTRPKANDTSKPGFIGDTDGSDGRNYYPGGREGQGSGRDVANDVEVEMDR